LSAVACLPVHLTMTIRWPIASGYLVLICIRSALRLHRDVMAGAHRPYLS
jgi:hypothetical protein